MSKVSLSLVIPVYNESESLQILTERILSMTSSAPQIAEWELIFVDDGSTDKSCLVLDKLSVTDPRLKVFKLRKNFGKSAALQCGFDHAKFDFVVTMDSDLQDDPAEVPNLIAKAQEGFDLVSGWKRERHDPFEKRFASKIFNFFVRKASGLSLNDFNCGLKIYRSWCVRELNLRGNQHRFIPVLLFWKGANVTELAVKHHRREFGKSKFGISRYLYGSFDLMTTMLVTRFAPNPLYFFAAFALPLLFIGTVIGAYLLFAHVLFVFGSDLGIQLNSRPLLIIAVFLFLAGLQIGLIGLTGELVIRNNSVKPYVLKD